jgi:hypothetical protein
MNSNIRKALDEFIDRITDSVGSCDKSSTLTPDQVGELDKNLSAASFALKNSFKYDTDLSMSLQNTIKSVRKDS